LILEEAASPEKLKEDFPWLFDADEV